MNLEEINLILKRKGYRPSKIRDKIITYFNKSSAPLSANELINKTRKDNLTPNKTTIYRELEKLLNENIISEVDLHDGLKRYEFFREANLGHYHLVCNSCGQIECIDIPKALDLMCSYIEETKNFKIEKHSLEFFGLCARCCK